MTVAEFLRWDSGDWSGRRWQLVDGEPTATDPASQTHGAIVQELARLLGNHLIELGADWRVVGEPGVAPGVRGADNCRVPDLGVTRSPDRSAHLLPDPVLLAEALSPSNHAQTRSNVWSYTTISSVAEVLILHSTRLEAELLRRVSDGSWPDAPEIIRPPRLLELTSVGFSVPLVAVYRTSGLI